MSNSGNESDRNDRRGRSNGSRKTHFSKENQPDRRRQPTRRKDLKASLVQLIRQPIKAVKDGKPTTIPFLEAFLHSLSQQLLKGTVPDKLKFIEKLDKLGILSLLTEQARLDDERAELQIERSDQDRRDYQQRLLLECAKEQEADLHAKWAAAAGILAAVLESCKCGACAGELSEEIDAILAIYGADVEAAVESERFGLWIREQAMHSTDEDDEEDAKGEFDDLPLPPWMEDPDPEAPASS